MALWASCQGNLRQINRLKDVFRNFSAGSILSYVRISITPHLERVEPAPLDLRDDPVANRPVDDREERHRQSEDHDDIDRHADQLSEELSGVAIEQAAHRTGHAVPAVAVAAISKYP